MKKRCVAIFAFSLLAIVPMFAQSELGTAQTSAGIGPQVGYFKSRDADDGRIMGGGMLRLKFASLGLEGSVNYREEDYDGGQITVKSFPVMVTGLIYPLPVLYGAIGAGWYNSMIDYKYASYTVSEDKQRFGWHFGAGTELPLGTSARLVGDIRWVFLDYDFQTVPGQNGLNSDFYVVSAGLLFNL
ncbi:MAG TPA: outer membrane beta-barrel protein [Bacteroidota bacterium]|jgi:hypothetical protein|nr:outer membrane beta-barrel protein [Bacteroidota bacterium]